MIPERYAPYTYSLFRIVLGFLFACHGVQKIFGAFGGAMGDGQPAVLMSQIGVAGIVELVGGVLVAIGLFTRPAAFLSSGLMAFAYFIGHASGGFLPMLNGGELAALYCFAFLYVSSRSAGPWSLDAMIGGGARRR